MMISILNIYITGKIQVKHSHNKQAILKIQPFMVQKVQQGHVSQTFIGWKFVEFRNSCLT